MLSPIALVLGIPQVLNSPLNYVNANVVLGNGNIDLQNFIAHSDAFMAQSKGVIPIADVLTNSPLSQPVELSLARAVAQKFSLREVSPQAAYVPMPKFVALEGTIGEPRVKTDKAVIAGLTVGAVGGKVGGVVRGVGGLLTGQTGQTATTTETQTNQATNTTKSKLNPLNLFKKK